MSTIAPATIEGWYALHQLFELDWAALSELDDAERRGLTAEVENLMKELAAPSSEGWSRAFRVVGGGADLMLVHFRPSLDELADVELAVRRSALGPRLHLTYDYLSVTEAGMYHATARAAAEAEPGSKEFRALLDEEVEAEKGAPHLRLRLYPEVPEGMRYVSFYPMSRRRAQGDNWYVLPVEERSKMMRDHGMIGRGYAGRIYQIISGSVGLDDWEWGVTLFTADPLEFKRIVTEMRYDEASSRFGEFGSFFTGIELQPDGWSTLLASEEA